MRIRELRVDNVRNVVATVVSPGSGINYFSGANGAGKTTLLEAVYLLSHARSFRSGMREALIRIGAESLQVFALVESAGAQRRVGLGRDKTGWSARIDGASLTGIVELLREVAVVCFEPGSHGLISGPGEERRRFLDWALFHVEPEFLALSRRYRRAVKQRNSLLRRSPGPADLQPWDSELAATGERLTALRENYIALFIAEFITLAVRFLPELGTPQLHFNRGWPTDADLHSALQQRAERDLARGHTSAGPHRADWRISFPKAPEREHLSRGQQKLCALACVLAQAELFAKQRGEWPIVCLDDLGSELDLVHMDFVTDWLQRTPAQVLISGTAPAAGVLASNPTLTRFHVEQGQVSRLL